MVFNSVQIDETTKPNDVAWQNTLDVAISLFYFEFEIDSIIR
jgi:hypothetical protein